jgi:hypothetical protein
MSKEEMDKKVYGGKPSCTESESIPLNTPSVTSDVIFSISEEDEEDMKSMGKLMVPSQTTVMQRREDARP